MASAMQQVSVVWEWENSQRRWRPYSPQVVQLLERALSKGLKSVYLGDAEPVLSNLSINIAALRQLCDSSDCEIVVRRRFYQPGSPAGRGATWQWAGDAAGEWHGYDMDVQCVVEQLWLCGEQTVDISRVFAHQPYIINFCNLTQVKTTSGFVRTVRRCQQAAYPLVKVSADEPVYTPPTLDEMRRLASAPPPSSVRKDKKRKDKDSCSGRKKLMKQLTKLSNRLVDSLERDDSTAAMGTGPGCSDSGSCSGSGRNAAVHCRVVCADNGGGPDTRRLSVATTSTYISQSSENSIYLMDTAASPHDPNEVSLNQLLLLHTAVVLPSAEDADSCCCICCDALTQSSPYGDELVLQFVSCRHRLHLDCLRAMVENSHQSKYLQCPYCHAIYGKKIGNQPPGRMSTRILPIPLGGYTCNTIELSYTISPGIQGVEHPNPGRPFKVRGFPRICYLPNTPQGQQVLSLLEEAWRRRLIFTVGQSSTTGEPDVVTWNGVHHKTELHGNWGGHGFPDPCYLNNVTAELNRLGVM